MEETEKTVNSEKWEKPEKKEEPAADREALLAENERLRAEVKRTRTAAALREALLARGAEPATVAMLAGSVDPDGLALDGTGALQRPEEVVEPLRARYGMLFRRTEEIPAPPLSPPAAPRDPPLTRDDLRRMSADEINARWEAVRRALGGG